MPARDSRGVLAEAARPRAHDLAPHADAVRGRHRGGRLEPLPQLGEPVVHVGIERQLALDHEWSDEDDAGAAVGGETAGEVERVLRLLAVEQRDGDAAVRDRARPAREMPGATMEEVKVRAPHRRS